MSTQLDTNDSFTYFWYIWRFVGIYPCSKYRRLYNIYGIVINLFASVLSPISIFINVFVLQQTELVMHCLQVSPTLIVSSAKQFVLFLRLSYLQNIKSYLNVLDRRANRNKEEVQYLQDTIRQCRFIVKAILVSISISLASYAGIGLIKRSLIFEGWFPFDWNSSAALYLFTFTFQFLSAAFQSIQNAANDGYPVVYMLVLKAHIHVLCMRVARIGKDINVTQDENYEELKSCVNDHKTIISLFENIKSVVRITVLMQFSITAFLLCITAVNFLIFNHGFDQLIITVMYVVAVLLAAFPVCYSGNLLLSTTDDLTTAIYNCNWMDQSVKFRKCIIIFMQRSQKNDPILAGGLVPITLQTFIDIIRFSFSLFTLLSEMQ